MKISLDNVILISVITQLLSVKPISHFSMHKIYNVYYDTYLADSNGLAFYIFQLDEPNYSNCNDECAENWPPVLVDENIELGADPGIDLTKIKKLVRKDGKTMISFNGWPLYYYKQDVYLTAYGQTLIENGGYFVLIQPDGSPNVSKNNDYQSLEFNNTIEVATNEKYGRYITNNNGVPLFTSDKDKFLMSTCDNDCLKNFKPYMLDEGVSPTYGKHIIGNFMILIDTPKGGKIITYNGLPLYVYNSDANSTDVIQGNNLNGRNWYTINPEGKMNIALYSFGFFIKLKFTLVFLITFTLL